jgi:Mn2+/Fe2+ NRAMP family transporter
LPVLDCWPGSSDDDPAGITIYSILGADYGSRLLWVLALSTVALIVFRDLAARTASTPTAGRSAGPRRISRSAAEA